MNNIIRAAELGPGLLLLVAAVQDMKRKEVSIWLLGIFGVLGIPVTLLNGAGGTAALPGALGGAAVGLLVILMSRLTEGAIGMGDGLLLTVTGIYLGFQENLFLFLCGAFLAAALSVVLLILKKVTRKTSCPFIPFLFAGYLMMKLL